MDTSVTDGGRNMKNYLKTPALVNKNDISKLENAVSEIDKMIRTLQDGKTELVTDWKSHITQDNIPKSYVKEEHLPYYDVSTKQIQDMMSELEHYRDLLLTTMKEIKQRHGMKKSGDAPLKRKLKENMHHAHLRKRQRMEERACRIAVKMGRGVIEGSISPEITGNFQISANEKQQLKAVLKEERKDDHFN